MSQITASILDQTRKCKRPTIVHNPRAHVTVTAANTGASGLASCETGPHVCPWKKSHHAPSIHPAVGGDLTPRSGPHMCLWCLQTPSVCLSVCRCYRAQHQLSPATSQSLDRRRGEQESVTIETSAAGCSLTHSLTYLLLYELKQGASIHILAREVRGAAEDKGIGRNKGGGGVAGGALQDGGGRMWL